MQPLESRPDPGKWKAVTLTVLVHVLLVAALIVGVRWQNRPPEAVEVEVWQAPPPAPAPVIEAERKPEPEPRKAEPPPPIKPDIVVKQEKPEPKKPKVKEPEPKKPEAKKPEAKKPEPPRLNFDAAMKQELAQVEHDKAVREKQLRAEQEAQQLKQAQAEQANAAKRTGLQKYQDAIRNAIRRNIVPPLDLKGNPVAVFLVTQIPGGEVIDVQKKRSSGVPAYDDAIERAIRKTRLPNPIDVNLFTRQLELTFCPDEARGCR